MAKTAQTSKKRPAKPFKGAVDGTPFSKTNQPTPEQKRKGWEEFRKERHLTQEIIKMMLGDDGQPNDNFKGYLQSLVTNAKLGNPKAIDAVNKCLEDEVIKVAATNAAGEDVNFKLLTLDPLIINDGTTNNSTSQDSGPAKKD